MDEDAFPTRDEIKAVFEQVDRDREHRALVMLIQTLREMNSAAPESFWAVPALKALAWAELIWPEAYEEATKGGE